MDRRMRRGAVECSKVQSSKFCSSVARQVCTTLGERVLVGWPTCSLKVRDVLWRDLRGLWCTRLSSPELDLEELGR